MVERGRVGNVGKQATRHGNAQRKAKAKVKVKGHAGNVEDLATNRGNVRQGEKERGKERKASGVYRKMTPRMMWNN